MKPLWHVLKTDSVFRAFLAATALIHAPYFLPFVDDPSLSLYTKHYNLIFLPLVAWTYLADLGQVRSFVERRFWRYLTYAWGLWWLPTLTRAFWPEAWRGQSFGLTTDGFFALYYFCWLIAVGLAPHRPPSGTLSAGVRRIRSAGTVVLILGLSIYFVIVPLRLTQTSVDAWAGSLFLFVILDLILFGRLSTLAYGCRSKKWRTLYGILAVGQLMHSYLDLQEGLIFSGLMSWPWGARVDWVWSLPFILMVGAARLRNVDFGDEQEVVNDDDAPIADQRLSRRGPLAFSLLLFPLIHIAGYRLQLLDPELREGRGTVVLICLSVLWILMILESNLLHKGLKHAAREHRELERLRLNQQLAEKSASNHNRFIANVSHEIRTPMNGILGMANILLSSPLASQDRRHVEILKSAAEGLLQLIDDILDFSKIDAGLLTVEMRRFNLREQLDQVIQLQRPKADAKGLELRLETAEDLPRYVVGDPLRLRQVLTNLVANAGKFTDKGSITLRATPAGPGPGPEAMPFVRFEVEDTGIGIAPKDHARLFEPFTQVDGSHSRNVGGAGLGLAICHQIVEHQGGEMRLKSDLGKGSTFSFTLPLREIRAPKLKAAPTKEPALVGHPRILLAEDNPINQMVAVHQLEELGAQVEVVENGRQALEALETAAYDLVLMDCQMPGMDGYEATEEIRRRKISSPAEIPIPIIAVTAHAFEQDRRRCMQSGMDDYLAKPYSQEVMVKMLNHWLQGDKDPRLDDSWISENAADPS